MEHDRKLVQLVPLLELSLEDQLKLSDIRNQENIRKWMYNNGIITILDHMTWIENIKNVPSLNLFAVTCNCFDKESKNTTWKSRKTMIRSERRFIQG